jgi:hypothetical protein
LTLQATTSGTIHSANAPQKISASIGPARNDKGFNCESLAQDYNL